MMQCRKAHKTISVSLLGHNHLEKEPLTLASTNFNKSVFLVGGFSASDFLFRRVKEGLERHGLLVFRPDTQVYAFGFAYSNGSKIQSHPFVATKLSPMAPLSTS
jgi:hypothetical protein